MQNIIVVAIVAIACWFVLKRYLPLTLRITIMQRSADLCQQVGWLQLATRLRARTASASAITACGSCKSCASAAAQAPATSFSITPEDLRKTIRR